MEKVSSVENDVEAVVDEKGSHLRSIFAYAVDSNARGDVVTQTGNGTMEKHDLETMNDVRGERPQRSINARGRSGTRLQRLQSSIYASSSLCF